MYNNNYQNQRPIIIQQNRTNGLGLAGFILSIISIFISWIPVLGWIVLGLAFLFSFIGLFMSPRGLAIAGFIISLLQVAVLLLFLLFSIALLPGLMFI